MRYKPGYTYLPGITPATNQPNMTTISNILNVLVDKLLQMNEVTMVTHQFLHGHKVIVSTSIASDTDGVSMGDKSKMMNQGRQ
ncbi:hypothetical protein VP01_1729g8 [Puccinia sorghi]|uniref:Uncharacterized protein n=1 Tax=Puccinia sorghi TaxID=27349 RepID=A0A0L6VF96_9BASI|nr:hypothetical protein VP01_1729g8 [Puccinia sorghi]